MKFKSWLWPNRNIGKRESAELRKEHNELVNAHAEAVDMLRHVERWMSGYGTKTQSEMRQEVRAAIAAATEAQP